MSKTSDKNGSNRQTTEEGLPALRKQIDGLDKKIQSLINERVGVAGKVAVYRPEREAQVLRRVKERNEGPLPDDEMVRLMREIMSFSLAAEMPINVAYLGPAGTYTQGAVVKHFGHAARTMDVKTIADVFKVVEEGRANFGVVPVENSTEGMISLTLDAFMDTELKVCGEVSLPIRHQLLSRADGMSKIKSVAAHPQALAQCRQWLNRYMPDVETQSTLSNAQAAIMAQKDNTLAAIASDTAAKLYDLDIIASGIEDDKMVSAPNKSGSLFSLIKPFSDHGVDMSRIESRPSRKSNWEYVFFIDVIGHEDDEAVNAALEDIKKEAAYFKLLGSYPRAAR